MKTQSLILFMLAWLPGLAHAESFDCELKSLANGTLIRNFKLKAPEDSRVLIKLPGSNLQLMTWMYEASIGIELENLDSHDIELSTQMSFDSSNGIFDLVYKPGNIRLTCESESPR